jgi:Ca-activated chloride channel family protein
MKWAVAAVCLFLATLLCVFAAQQGPSREGGETVVKPKKKETAPAVEQPKIPSKYPKKADLPADVPRFRSDVFTVSVDVTVLDPRGRPIPDIGQGNFRVLEDNVPQKVESFEPGEAPMTVCLVIEFSNLFQSYYSETWFQTLQASYGFMDALKPEDYLAVVTYDMKSEILSDFSTDRREAQAALQQLRFAGFSEANLFDALADTAERMRTIEGRKAIVVLSSGIDTFSKLTYDKARKSLQASQVPVFAIGLMQSIRIRYESRMGAIARMDFMQADNQMRTFANETGGQAFFPRFEAEFPGIFKQIGAALRTRYNLTYHPLNQARDGKYRKIKVELVKPGTDEPLPVKDEKGKPAKLTIIAKPGYTAPMPVE